MLANPPPRAFEALRVEIAKIEARGRAGKGVLAFGIPELDRRLPGGGLPLGALHEVAGGGAGAVDGASSALFAAGLAARSNGQVLWCITRPDLFAPALFQAGLAPKRVIYLEAGDEKTLLACCEEGLRHGGLGAVIGEVSRLSSTASRRLQLAAEASSTMAIIVRRWRRQQDAADFGQPTAATTRWRVSPLPSSALPTPGVGRARWFVELIRCKAGERLEFELEAPDAAGRLALPADVAYGPAAATSWERRAAG
jgi:protein ImuA